MDKLVPHDRSQVKEQVAQKGCAVSAPTTGSSRLSFTTNMIATNIALTVLSLTTEWDGERSCAVCSDEEQTEGTTPS